MIILCFCCKCGRKWNEKKWFSGRSHSCTSACACAFPIYAIFLRCFCDPIHCRAPKSLSNILGWRQVLKCLLADPLKNTRYEGRFYFWNWKQWTLHTDQNWIMEAEFFGFKNPELCNLFSENILLNRFWFITIKDVCLGRCHCSHSIHYNPITPQLI